MDLLRDMELDDERQLDAPQPIPMPDRPRFPYGLQIALTECEMDKLDLDAEDARVGEMCHGHFIARVTSVSSNDTDHGKKWRVELQIEHLAIEVEGLEDEEAERTE